MKVVVSLCQSPNASCTNTRVSDVSLNSSRMICSILTATGQLVSEAAVEGPGIVAAVAKTTLGGREVRARRHQPAPCFAETSNFQTFHRRAHLCQKARPTFGHRPRKYNLVLVSFSFKNSSVDKNQRKNLLMSGCLIKCMMRSPLITGWRRRGQSLKVYA